MLDTLENVNLDDAGDIVIGAATLACVAMIFFAGNAIAFSMVTALLGTASVLYLLLQAKNTSNIGAHTWNFCMENRLTADIVISGGFVLFFGTGTATALLSAGAAGVMTSWCLGKFNKKIGVVPMPHKKPNKSKEVKSYQGVVREDPNISIQTEGIAC